MPTNAASSAGSLVRRLVRWLAGIYYPVIKVTGAERIPRSGPVLICINHPNSLLDPILVGMVCERPVRFMAKAPLFQVPVLGGLMRRLGMIPAYRGSDDRKQVRRNLESLDAGVEALLAGDAFGIFPEGKSHDEYRVEMVRSGAARIALQAVERGLEGLVVLPIGLNYGRKEAFRSAVWAAIGQPILVTPPAQDDPKARKAMRDLTQKIQESLESSVVHLDQTEWEPFLEDLQRLFHGPTSIAAIEQRKQIADGINRVVANDPERAATLAGKIEDLRQELGRFRVGMDAQVLRTTGAKLAGAIGWRLLAWCLGLVPALLGLAFHGLPFLLNRGASDWVRPRGRTAISLYRLLLGVPIYGLWYGLAVALAATQGVGWPWILLGLVVLPPSGILALHYWPHAWRSLPQSLRQAQLLARPGNCRRLRQQRQALRAELLQISGQPGFGSPPAGCPDSSSH